MTKIKICGLRRLEDVRMVNRYRPEYIGLNFAPASRRYVTEEEGAALAAALDPSIVRVGVFVNAPPEQILRLLEKGVIQMVQLHGQENEAYLAALRQRTSRPILQAFRVETKADVSRAAASSADCILLDGGAGGSGQAFDWSLLGQVTRPFFLAGGLHPGNVRSAVETLRPYAADVSSGVETDGWKDEEKIKQFIQAVREDASWYLS